MKKYQIILFDADETLFDFKKAEQFALQNTMLEFAIAYDESYHLQLYKEINTAIWKEFENGLIQQSQINRERFIRLSIRLNAGFDGVAFAESYARHLSGASYLYADSLRVVESLSRDYRLGIITNGLKDIQNRRIRQSRIAHFFETIVISEEIAVAKPDSRIFEHALQQMKQLDKRRVLMVGDSLISDIQGGINCTIDTCWFNPHRIENSTAIKPTYEIANLPELEELLA